MKCKLSQQFTCQIKTAGSCDLLLRIVQQKQPDRTDLTGFSLTLRTGHDGEGGGAHADTAPEQPERGPRAHQQTRPPHQTWCVRPADLSLR